MAVILAIGFGVFLIATLYVVQKNLVDHFAVDTRPDRPNLVLFDIQSDQKEGVARMLAARGMRSVQLTPIVPGRIAKINGVPIDQIAYDKNGHLPARWALRREYRNTYRDTLVASEQLVAGGWWAPHPLSLAQVSVEEELAKELGVALGDSLTWDVQGVLIGTRIASLRHVTWARFEPNFFVVFAPGALEGAPQSLVSLTRIDRPSDRGVFQRRLAERLPNARHRRDGSSRAATGPGGGLSQHFGRGSDAGAADLGRCAQQGLARHPIHGPLQHREWAGDSHRGAYGIALPAGARGGAFENAGRQGEADPPDPLDRIPCLGLAGGLHRRPARRGGGLGPHDPAL